MEFRRPDSLCQVSSRPSSTDVNMEDEDTMTSLDLYIETLEADKREEKTWLPPPSPMHSSDSNFDIYSGLDNVTSKTSSDLYNYNCKPLSYKNQLMGSLRSRESPQYSDRSHDCHFASPKPSQSDLESDQSDREQDAAGISSFQGPSTSAGTSCILQESRQPFSSQQTSGVEDSTAVERQIMEQEPCSSPSVDPLEIEKATCSKPGKDAEVVLAPTSKDYNDLLEKYRILRGNMLSLLRTAQAELKCKTDTINELREAAKSQDKMLGKGQALKVNASHTSTQTEPVSSVSSTNIGSSQHADSAKTAVSTDKPVQVEPVQCRGASTQTESTSKNVTVQTKPRSCENLSVQTEPSACRNWSIQTEPTAGRDIHCQTEAVTNSTVHVQTEPAVLSGLAVSKEKAVTTRRELAQTDFPAPTSSQTPAYPAVKTAGVSEPSTPDLQIASSSGSQLIPKDAVPLIETVEMRNRVPSISIIKSKKRRCSASPHHTTPDKKGRSEKHSSARKPALCIRSTSLDSSLTSGARDISKSSELNREIDVLPDCKANTNWNSDIVPTPLDSADSTSTGSSSEGFGACFIMGKNKDSFQAQVQSVTPGEVITVDLSLNDDDIQVDSSSDEELVSASTIKSAEPQASTTVILLEEHQELGSVDLQDNHKDITEEADMDQEVTDRDHQLHGDSSQFQAKPQNTWRGQDETISVISEEPEYDKDRDTRQFHKLSSVPDHDEPSVKPAHILSGGKQKVFRLPTPLRLTQSSKPCTAYLSPVQAVTPPHPDQAKVTGGPFAAVKGDAWKRKLLLWVDYSHKRISRRKEIDAVFSGQRSPQVYDWVNVPSKEGTPRNIPSPLGEHDQPAELVQRNTNQEAQPKVTSESCFSAKAEYSDQRDRGEIQVDNESCQEWLQYSRGKDQQVHETRQFVEGRSDAIKVLSQQNQEKKVKRKIVLGNTEEHSKKSKQKGKQKDKIKKNKTKNQRNEVKDEEEAENIKGINEKEVRYVSEKGTDKAVTKGDEIRKAENENTENEAPKKFPENQENGTEGNQKCETKPSLVCVSESTKSPTVDVKDEDNVPSPLTTFSLHSTNIRLVKTETDKEESLVCEDGSREDDENVPVMSDSDSVSIFTDVEDSSPRKPHRREKLVHSEAMEYSASDDECTQDLNLVPEIRSPSAFMALYASRSNKNFESVTPESRKQPSEEDESSKLGVCEQAVVDSSGNSVCQDAAFKKSEHSSTQNLPSKDDDDDVFSFSPTNEYNQVQVTPVKERCAKKSEHSSTQNLPSKDDDDDVFSFSPTNEYNQVQVTPVKERCAKSESSAAMEADLSTHKGTPETKGLAFRKVLLSSPSVIWSPEKTSYNVISTREPVSSGLFQSLAGFSIVGKSHSSEDSSASTHSGSALLPSLQQKESVETSETKHANETVVENSEDRFLSATEHSVSAPHGTEAPSRSCAKLEQNKISPLSGSQGKAEMPVDLPGEENGIVARDKEMETGDEVLSEAVGTSRQCSDNAPLFGYPSLTVMHKGPSKLCFQYKRTPIFLASSSSSTSATSATTFESLSSTSVISSSSSSTFLAEQHPPQMSKHSVSPTEHLEIVGEEGSSQRSTGFDVNVHSADNASLSSALRLVCGVTSADDSAKKPDIKEKESNHDINTLKAGSPLNDGGLQKTSKDSSQPLVSAVQLTPCAAAENKRDENVAPLHLAAQSKDKGSIPASSLAASQSDPDLEEGEILETFSNSDKPEDEIKESNTLLGIAEDTLEEGEIRTSDGFSPTYPAQADKTCLAAVQRLEHGDNENAHFADLRELLQHKKEKSFGSSAGKSTSSPDPSERNRKRAGHVPQSRSPSVTESFRPVAVSALLEGERSKKKKTVGERNQSRNEKLSSHSSVDSTAEDDKDLEILKQKIRTKQNKLRRLIVSQHGAGSISDSDADQSSPSLKKYTIPKLGKSSKAENRKVPTAENNKIKHRKPTSLYQCKDKMFTEPSTFPISQTSPVSLAGSSSTDCQLVPKSGKNVPRSKSKGGNVSAFPKQSTKLGRNQASLAGESTECMDSFSMNTGQDSRRGHSVSHQKPAVIQGAKNCRDEVVEDDDIRDAEEIDVVNGSFVELKTNGPNPKPEGCNRTQIFNYFRDPLKVRPRIKELGDDDEDDEEDSDEEHSDEEHNRDDKSDDHNDDHEQASDSDRESDQQQTTDSDTEEAQEDVSHKTGEGECENRKAMQKIGNVGDDDLNKSENKLAEESCSSAEETDSDKDFDDNYLEDCESDGAYGSDSDEEKTAEDKDNRSEPKPGQTKHGDNDSSSEMSDGSDVEQKSQSRKEQHLQGNTTTLAASASYSSPTIHPTNIQSSVDCLSLDAFAFGDGHILLEQSEEECEKLTPQTASGTENGRKGNPQAANSAKYKDTARPSAIASCGSSGVTTAVKASDAECMLPTATKSNNRAEQNQSTGSGKRNCQNRGQKSNSPDSGSENNLPKRSRRRDSLASSGGKWQKTSSMGKKSQTPQSKPRTPHSETPHHSGPEHRSSCCSLKENERSSNRHNTSSDRQGQENTTSSSKRKQPFEKNDKSCGGRGRSSNVTHRRTSTSPCSEGPARQCRCCEQRSTRRSPLHGRHKTDTAACCQGTRHSSPSRSRSGSKEPHRKPTAFGNRHNKPRHSRSQSRSPGRERRGTHSGHSCEKHHHHRSRTRSRERNPREDYSHTSRDDSVRRRSSREHRSYRESSRSPRRRSRCSCIECFPSHSRSGHCRGETRRSSRSPVCRSGCCSNKANLNRRDARQNINGRKFQNQFYRR